MKFSKGFISRKDLGWPPSAAPSKTKKTLGIKIHYEGTHSPVRGHSYCKGYWTGIRNSHLANKAEGYSDVAYSMAVCRHGYVMEGRGIGYRTGANGNQTLNGNHDSVVVLYGTNDDAVSAEVVQGLKEAIQYLRSGGSGTEIKGHRDGYPTLCPGGPLYAYVKNGKLNPDLKDDDQVTPADINKIADAVVDRLLSADKFTAPKDAADYSDDPKNPRHYWTGRSVFADLVTRVRSIDKKLK